MEEIFLAHILLLFLLSLISLLVGERSSEKYHSRPSFSNSHAQLRSFKQAKTESWREILVGESFAAKVRRKWMATRSNVSPPLQEFAAALGARDPKTVATYLTTVRDFVAWLATQPGGTAFHLGLVTETAVRGYMDFL